MYDDLHPPVIGLVTMGNSALIEHYFHLHAPGDILVTSTRVPFREVSRAGMEEMISHLPAAASLLHDANPSVLVIPNFTASCLMGQEMINVLQQTVGIPVVVPGKAYINVLRRNNCKSLAILSSFSLELNMAERIFFERNGIHITRIEPLTHNFALLPNETVELDPDILRAGIQTLHPLAADAVLIDSPLFFPTSELEAALSLNVPLLSMCPILLDEAIQIVRNR